MEVCPRLVKSKPLTQGPSMHGLRPGLSDIKQHRDMTVDPSFDIDSHEGFDYQKRPTKQQRVVEIDDANFNDFDQEQQVEPKKQKSFFERYRTLIIVLIIIIIILILYLGWTVYKYEDESKQASKRTMQVQQNRSPPRQQVQHPPQQQQVQQQPPAQVQQQQTQPTQTQQPSSQEQPPSQPQPSGNLKTHDEIKNSVTNDILQNIMERANEANKPATQEQPAQQQEQEEKDEKEEPVVVETAKTTGRKKKQQA